MLMNIYLILNLLIFLICNLMNNENILGLNIVFWGGLVYI